MTKSVNFSAKKRQLNEFCQAVCQKNRSISRSGLQGRCAEETDSRITEISRMGVEEIELTG
jgi:mRNA-degrading endonuclease toxin of MazEF toxin-antitoxin module